MQFAPFGDSHSVFWGKQQSFDTPYSNVEDTPNLHWIGPAKIYGLENETNNNTKEKFSNFKALMFNQPKVIPICCLGEIDIRVNVTKLILEDRDFSHITNLAKLYLRKINELPNQQIIIWGPPPASMSNDGLLSQDYPFYGSGISRNAVIHLFNSEILKNLNEYPRIKFITLFYDLVDSDLVTHPFALHDVNHLSINHFMHARELLAAVLDVNAKAAFDQNKMQSITNIDFFIQPVQSDSLSYSTNMLFSGPISFQYFSNIKFHNPEYQQHELVIRPGIRKYSIPNPVQIRDFAFLEIFFQGRSKNEFIDFSRFCASFNSSEIDIFDVKDGWSSAFKVALKKHEKLMMRRYALSHASEQID